MYLYEEYNMDQKNSKKYIYEKEKVNKVINMKIYIYI